MGLNKISYLLLILLFLISCDNSPNQASDNPEITTGFSLLDSTGANTTTFRIGADLHFKYSLTNETGETQNYFIPDTGPFVSFEILRTGVPLGSSEDGFNYAPSISEDSLAADESIARDYNWYSSSSHQILTEGDYKARATPRLQFNDTETPAFEEIDFSITANANFQLGDSTDLVIITGQSPASLQLDAFTLNSVAVSGDTVTLNLSYSGGCLEHDFSLFMSPGAFLESLPVQANLFLWHDGKNDPCDAIITVDVIFNLLPVVELQQFFYGGKDEIVLNLFEYFETQPGTKLSASYFPQ